MSVPTFPKADDSCTLDHALCRVLTSIAMEEAGLSHVLNAEGEKLQYVLGTLHPGEGDRLSPTVDEILKVNESVEELLRGVSYTQMLLNAKMMDALKMYLKNKEMGGDEDNGGDGGDGGNGGDGGETGDTDLPLKNGEGPYDTRDDADDQNKNFAMLVTIEIPYGATEPTIIIMDNGSVKLKDILNGSDFSGITVRAKDPAQNAHFWIEKDKAGDWAIRYDYVPDIDVWDAAENNLPVVTLPVILSKPGYKDAEIKIILRYTGSLFSRG